MAFSAGEVIAGARAYHPAFDDVSHPDVVCFDWLNGFIRRERRQLMSLYPTTLLTQMQTTVFPPVTFYEGIPIPAAEMVFSVMALSGQQGEIRGDPVALIAVENMQDPGAWPAVAWVGGGMDRLYLKGALSDWKDYVGLLVNFIAYPTPLVALSSDVDLPDQFFDSCLTNLAVFLAFRSGGETVGQQQMSYLRGEAGEARTSALASMSAQRAGETFRIREMD